MADSVTDALRDGWIPLGSARLRIGSRIRDAAEALGLDPERPAYRWQEVDGREGQRWTVRTAYLWSPPPPHGVELVFHDDALTRVRGADAAWESSGTSWSDYDEAVEIRNYWKSRKDLESRLGPPQRCDERSNSLLVAAWALGRHDVTLCWETRTPELSIWIGPPKA